MRRSGVAITGIPAIALAILLIFWGDHVLSWVYGDPFFAAGWSVLIIMSIGQVTNACAGPCGIVLVMTGHERTIMVTTTASFLVALGMSIVLGLLYGKNGVAIGFSAALIQQNLLLLYYAYRKVGVWTFVTFRPGILW